MPHFEKYFYQQLNSIILSLFVELVQQTNKVSLGGSPGLVVTGGNSCSEGHGFESQHHILDGHFSNLFVVKIVIFV